MSVCLETLPRSLGTNEKEVYSILLLPSQGGQMTEVMAKGHPLSDLCSCHYRPALCAPATLRLILKHCVPLHVIPSYLHTFFW